MNTAPVLLPVKPSSMLCSNWHDWLDEALAGYRIQIPTNGGFPPFLFAVSSEVKHGGIAELILNEIRRGGYEIA